MQAALLFNSVTLPGAATRHRILARQGRDAETPTA